MYYRYRIAYLYENDVWTVEQVIDEIPSYSLEGDFNTVCKHLAKQKQLLYKQYVENSVTLRANYFLAIPKPEREPPDSWTAENRKREVQFTELRLVWKQDDGEKCLKVVGIRAPFADELVALEADRLKKQQEYEAIELEKYQALKKKFEVAV